MFLLLLIDFHFLGSKDGVAIVSACSPVLKWLSDHSKEKIPFPKESDVISFFDNNQVPPYILFYDQ